MILLRARGFAAFLIALTISVAAWSPSLAADPTPSHLAAAERFLEETKVAASLAGAIQGLVDLQLRGNPSMTPFRSVYLDFFERYMSWENIKDEAAKTVAGEFTEAELDELSAFYATPIGAKSLVALPALTQQIGGIGMERMRGREGELDEMVRKRAEELKSEQ